MFAFDDQERKDARQKMTDTLITPYIPVVANVSASVADFSALKRSPNMTELCLKPSHERFVAIRDGDNGKMNRVRASFLPVVADTSFAVNDSCEISFVRFRAELENLICRFCLSASVMIFMWLLQSEKLRLPIGCRQRPLGQFIADQCRRVRRGVQSAQDLIFAFRPRLAWAVVIANSHKLTVVYLNQRSNQLIQGYATVEVCFA